jgi:hypothetical protein
MLEDILLSLNKEDLEKLPREAQEKLLALVRAVLGRVLINASSPDVRFCGITGHCKATLNRSRMTRSGVYRRSRALDTFDQ